MFVSFGLSRNSISSILSCKVASKLIIANMIHRLEAGCS